MTGMTRREAITRIAAGGIVAARPSARAAEGASTGDPTRWLSFPKDGDEEFSVRGLPWFAREAPALRRLPADAEEPLRATNNTRQVWRLAQAPSGGRVRFRSDTGQLKIRINVPSLAPRQNSMSAYGSHGLDVYVDGAYWASVLADRAGDRELTFFSGAERKPRSFEIYLAIGQPLKILQVGIDADSKVEAPLPFAVPSPLVVYGSSISQGIGACRPGMSYGAILTRKLGLDHVNFGFSGAGKAEAVVVDYVKRVEACGFVLDVGLSYGRPPQPGKPYEEMLATLRAAHPDAWLFCIAPILGPIRNYASSHALANGDDVRGIVRDAVRKRRDSGDARVRLVEGDDLLAPHEADAFHEGLHPTDLGYSLVADRLGAVLGPLLLGGR